MTKKNNLKNHKNHSSDRITAQSVNQSQNAVLLSIVQEFKDYSRKDVQKWRQAINAAENPDDPRWFMMQDLIDNLLIDAHLASAVAIRKAATLNHPFYVIDRKTGEKLTGQTELLNKKWFYDFLNFALDAIARKYSVIQLFCENGNIKIDLIPFRNVCPQLHRIYTEVGGSNFIDYAAIPTIIEVLHSSPFGLVNDVAANVIMKINLMQSNAEFSERFGMPLITATTSNRADVPKIEQSLASIGEAGSAVLPTGADIKIHSLSNAGNPEKVYLEPALFHDNQVSKRFLGSTTIVDEGANRAQTQVHMETLDDKLAVDDKRMISFLVNDRLFPVLNGFGFPFDGEKMSFRFDENENLTLPEQWEITQGALGYFELDEKEIGKTFNLPVTGVKNLPPAPSKGGRKGNGHSGEEERGLSANFR